LSLVVLLTAAATGCGGSHKTSGAPPTAQTTTAAPPATTTTVSGPGALQAEANSLAAGDIPDNQVFLVFRSAAAGFAMKYPEGWAVRSSGDTVTFRDKNNIVRVAVGRAASPTEAGVHAEVSRLPHAAVSGRPVPLTLGGGKTFKVTYKTESAPNTVTGKRVTLMVDRYYVWKGGRLAVVDLGTPAGVDNVDAYRLMIESFRWR
jgi:hypothetical protein